MKINITSTSAGTLISDLEAGDVFEYTTSSNDNNGICLRLKDSKVGKGRFTNLESGKVLTAGCGDRGIPVNASLSID